MSLVPSLGVNCASAPRKPQEEAFCSHCGRVALPARTGRWGKVKAVLWDAEHPLTLEEISAAAGINNNAAAVALHRHHAELVRTGTKRQFLYRLRWKA